MAEVKLFEIDLTDSIVSIERLKNELRVVKKEFEAAQVGTAEFDKLATATKTLNADIKKLSDAAKANSNALGGINTSAKFLEGSYGALKQKIKENKDELDKVRTTGKLYKALQQEQVSLLNQELAIRDKFPSRFKEAIKGAVNEANALKDLQTQLKNARSAALGGDKEAAKQVVELQSKLDDLKDTMVTLSGSGIEQVKNSTALLQEGFANFDLGKIENALDGVANSMKAIPIFLLIEGIKFLAENIDEVVGYLNSFTGEAKEVKKLEKALEDVTKETEKQKVALNGLVAVGEAQLDLLKAQGASYDTIKKKEGEIFNSKLQLIRVEGEQIKMSALTNIAKLKEISANDDVTESIQRISASYQRKLGNDVIADAIEKGIADSKKKRSKELTDALAADQNKLTQLQTDLSVLLIQNETKEKEAGNARSERNKQRKQEEQELQDYLRQLSIDAIKDEQDRQVNQLIFDQELAKREATEKIKDKTLLDKALKDIDASFNQQQLELQKQFAKQQFDIEKEKNDKLIEEQKAVREYEYNEAIAAQELIIAQQQQNITAVFEARKKILEEQKEKELQDTNLTYSQRLLIEQEFQTNITKLQQEEVNKRRDIRNAEISIVKDSYTALLNVAQLFAQTQEEQATLSKIGALATIGANTGIAISNMVATSFSPSSPDNIATGGIAAYAKLIAGVAAISANMVQAKQLINSFEEGGYTGEGASNEVSTNLGKKSYTYHKDEYVIPSRVLNTPLGGMLASKAESMRLGMSNPMPYIGGMFDGGFTARAAGSDAMNSINNNAMMQSFIAKLPQPVVKVTDINKVSTQSERAVTVSSL